MKPRRPDILLLPCCFCVAMLLAMSGCSASRSDAGPGTGGSTTAVSRSTGAASGQTANRATNNLY